jgi:hypothetical protein
MVCWNIPPSIQKELWTRLRAFVTKEPTESKVTFTSGLRGRPIRRSLKRWEDVHSRAEVMKFKSYGEREPSHERHRSDIANDCILLATGNTFEMLAYSYGLGAK